MNEPIIYDMASCDCIGSLKVGDLVREDVIDYVINAMPPACMRSDCTQIGEPKSHRCDEAGRCRATYATFKKVSHDVWQYCGDCFRGENVQRQ